MAIANAFNSERLKAFGQDQDKEKDDTLVICIQYCKVMAKAIRQRRETKVIEIGNEVNLSQSANECYFRNNILINDRTIIANIKPGPAQ